MEQITVLFSEPLHHVCLMYGLKQTFGRMPFLNRKVLNVGGKRVILNNAVAPPPMMRNPEKSSRNRKIRSLVEVSYWKDRIIVEYNEEICTSEDITAFTQTLIQDYLSFRHPLMKTSSEDGLKVSERLSGHKIAEINI